MELIYLASVIGGVFYGITETINKSVVEEKYSAFSYAFIQHALNAALYLIPFLLFFELPAFGPAYILLGIASAGVFAANILIIRAYKSEDVSAISIVSRMSLVIAYATGVIALSEPSGPAKTLGMLAIAAGSVLIFYEARSFHINRRLVPVLISSFIFGIIPLVDKTIMQSMQPLTYIFFMQVAAGLPLLFIAPVRRDTRTILKRKLVPILVSRVTAVSSIFLYLWAVRGGQISVVNTNFETVFLLTSVAAGVLLLKERGRLSQKLLGTGLCVLGIIFLNAG